MRAARHFRRAAEASSVTTMITSTNSDRPAARRGLRVVAALLAASAIAAACSSDADVAATIDDNEATAAATTEGTEASDDATATNEPASSGATASYSIDVWADNWSAVYVNGELIGEDSVSITTERSFNKETFTFEAAAPFTIAIEAKDFKETDSGIEYIGLDNQQMGDGGIIAQVINTDSGNVVAVTDAAWQTLVVHRAPLNTDCERDDDPDTTCEFEITETPADWTSAGFDDSAWTSATEWSADAVGPKDGYDEIAWDSNAQLIWGTDLEVDNTVLLRFTVA